MVQSTVIVPSSSSCTSVLTSRRTWSPPQLLSGQLARWLADCSWSKKGQLQPGLRQSYKNFRYQSVAAAFAQNHLGEYWLWMIFVMGRFTGWLSKKPDLHMITCEKNCLLNFSHFPFPKISIRLDPSLSTALFIFLYPISQDIAGYPRL